MIRYCAATLALLAISGFAATSAFARGGHGGGHHGGGHHSGGHHAGGHHAGGHQGEHHGEHHASHHHSHHGDHHSGHHYHHAHWSHHNRPFTHGWYGNHGGWNRGWGAWGFGGPWTAATMGATAAWLSLPAIESYAGTSGVDNGGTVYTADNSADDAADDQDEADDNLQPIEASTANTLARSGAADPTKENGLLPLGVYTLAPKGQQEATAMLQIGLTKDGIVRGTYADLVSDQGQVIRGAVDKKTQRVAFTVGPNSKVVFQTALASLTQDAGPVFVQYENGKTSTWTIARYEDDGSGANDDQDGDDNNRSDGQRRLTPAPSAPAVPN